MSHGFQDGRKEGRQCFGPMATFSAGLPGLVAAVCLTKSLLEATDRQRFFCAWGPSNALNPLLGGKNLILIQRCAAEATTAIAQLACPPAMSSVEHVKRPGESALWEPGWKL